MGFVTILIVAHLIKIIHLILVAIIDYLMNFTMVRFGWFNFLIIFKLINQIIGGIAKVCQFKLIRIKDRWHIQKQNSLLKLK